MEQTRDIYIHIYIYIYIYMYRQRAMEREVGEREKKGEKEKKREPETDRHVRFNKKLLVYISICFQCRIWKSHQITGVDAFQAAELKFCSFFMQSLDSVICFDHPHVLENCFSKGPSDSLFFLSLILPPLFSLLVFWFFVFAIFVIALSMSTEMREL